MTKNKPAWPADKVERRAIDSLIPYARNARTHSNGQVDQIAALDGSGPARRGVIIAGHGRVLAARRLGITSSPSPRSPACMASAIPSYSGRPNAKGGRETSLRGSKRLLQRGLLQMVLQQVLQLQRGVSGRSSLLRPNAPSKSSASIAKTLDTV
jgi:hypothetical protein